MKMKSLLLLALMMLLPFAANAEPQDEPAYRGKIGQYKVTLVFYTFNFDKGDVAGYYYYNDRPKTRFKLVCRKNEGDPRGFNTLVLDEYTPKGKNTGTFRGTLEGRGDGFYGTFTNSKGERFKFDLHQEW
jgi:hypothetical protein